jgi:hypothetical protein
MHLDTPIGPAALRGASSGAPAAAELIAESAGPVTARGRRVGRFAHGAISYHFYHFRSGATLARRQVRGAAARPGR